MLFCKLCPPSIEKPSAVLYTVIVDNRTVLTPPDILKRIIYASKIY